MSHQQILVDVAARGLSLSVAGSDLRLLGPRDRMDPELIGRIKAHKAELLAHLAPPAEGLRLTPLQRAYLVGRADVGSVASHVYSEIEGCWDIDRLSAALAAVVARHDGLCCRFTAEGRQIVDRSVPTRIGRHDLRGLDPAAQAQQLAARRDDWSHRVLPADQAPLLVVDVSLLADDRMILHISQDGLVLDAISTFLLHRAWSEGYRRSGPAPDANEESGDQVAELALADYLAALDIAHTRPAAQRSREYWSARLDEMAPPPALPLRLDPATVTAPRYTPRAVRLDPATWAALKKRGADAGVTPSVLLMAAYAEALAACGAGSRFTLTTTVANRPPIHPRMFDAIGNFSDTLLVEVALDPAASFADRATALQARMRQDLDHRHHSGVDVLREQAARRGAAPAPFTFNSAIGYLYADVDAGQLEAFGREIYSVSQTPQVWVNVFAAEAHGGLVVKIDGIDELFPDGLLNTLAEAYQRMLCRLAEPPGSSSDAWLASSVDLLPPVQRHLRDAANHTTVSNVDAMLTDAFVRQAEASPDAVAVIAGGITLSYAHLLHRALNVADWLRRQGLRREEPVALVMRRGLEQVVATMGVLLAGGAYLPLDADTPPARRDYVLRDGGIRLALTNVDGLALDGVTVSRVDTTKPLDGPRPPFPAPMPGSGPDDLAYVMYTSGTTGEPKGVMVTHRAVANVVADCAGRFGITAADRFFAISAFTFDLSVYDLIGALSSGAALVLPDADLAADAAHWIQRGGAAGVTVWNSVPAIVALLAEQAASEQAGTGPAVAERAATDDAGAPPLPDLRLIMMSGDRIPAALPGVLRAQWPRATLVSLGGPTETTIWNICHPITTADDGSRPVPYGRPMANSRLYVVDADGRDMPDGCPGEIWAAGVGLARGYWGDAKRTAARFVDDPRRGRLFRTGDIGRYLPDGEVDILGRIDQQIKVNGYRIEAGEVEVRLLAIPGIGQAAVVAAPGAGGARLVAHLAAGGPASSGGRPEEADIRRQLAVDLPAYMIPSAIAWHDELPLTRNGKVDRSALAALAGASPTTVDGLAPQAGTVEVIAGLWAEALRVKAVAPRARFGDLGGDSIAAARIVTAVRKRYGVTIPLHRLAEVDTVEAMARYVEDSAGR